jgi:hypothetical protein
MERNNAIQMVKKFKKEFQEKIEFWFRGLPNGGTLPIKFIWQR